MTAPETSKDPFIREKFTKERTAARNFAKEWRLRCILTDLNTRHSRNVQQEHSKEAANRGP
jgi:hypothetical protein